MCVAEGGRGRRGERNGKKKVIIPLKQTVSKPTLPPSCQELRLTLQRRADRHRAALPVSPPHHVIFREKLLLFFFFPSLLVWDESEGF